MKIYTRSGDDGETGLFGGQRVTKSDARVSAYGDVDELNAHLGWVDSISGSEELRRVIIPIQSTLFDIGADLATPSDSSAAALARTTRVDGNEAKNLERHIDHFDAQLKPLRAFVLPGGSKIAAALQICRVVCRRAERSVVALAQDEEVNPRVLVFLNRLSDLLFVLARWENHRAGIEEPLWLPGEAGQNDAHQPD